MTKILCIHGIGHAESDENFESSWQKCIAETVARVNPLADIEFEFFRYDQLFEEARIDGGDYAEAVLRLLTSGVAHTVGDLFRRGRGIDELPERLRWTAGMVAQWVANERLRDTLRDGLLESLSRFGPDLVCAHSLGSLVAYDTLRQEPGPMEGRCLLTFGSQIGNPAVREVFGGRIEGIPGIGRWFHLFNPEDHVFTAPLRIPDNSFGQVLTPFDKPEDILNHDATWYLSRPETRAGVWSRLFPQAAGRALLEQPGRVARVLRPSAASATAPEKPTAKALLIGINAYPNPADRLEGCVNDVFLMSSVLQESGFDPEDIRIVLDDRATAAGIRERLTWLLADTRPGDRRMLFYSGHGAQIPALNVRGEADRLDECLCPWDFDWTPERAITDGFFRDLYAQLPYDSQFVAIFDCCHSGGMTRDGGRRARGLTPPDDIRHRMLRWDDKLQMWVERDWVQSMRQENAEAENKQTAGNRTSIRRLGQAIAFRGTDDKAYDRRRERYGHFGPYLPVLMHACREEQLSYEYRHGVTSYGAFTYALAHILRTERQNGKNLSFKALLSRVADRLKALNYQQAPVLVGPQAILKSQIPWAGKAGKEKRSPRNNGG